MTDELEWLNDGLQIELFSFLLHSPVTWLETKDRAERWLRRRMAQLFS